MSKHEKKETKPDKVRWSQKMFVCWGKKEKKRYIKYQQKK